MNTNNGTIVLETSKLSHTLTLKAVTIEALVGMPSDVNGLSIVSAFIKEHPQYDTAKGLRDVQNMVYVRNVTCSVLLGLFVAFCSKVKSGELNEAA